MFYLKNYTESLTFSHIKVKFHSRSCTCSRAQRVLLYKRCSYIYSYLYSYMQPRWSNASIWRISFCSSLQNSQRFRPKIIMEILGISHYPSDVVTNLSTYQNRTTVGLMLPVSARFWPSSQLLLVCLLGSCRSDLMQPCLLWDNKADGYSLMEISRCMTKWL